MELVGEDGIEMLTHLKTKKNVSDEQTDKVIHRAAFLLKM